MHILHARKALRMGVPFLCTRGMLSGSSACAPWMVWPVRCHCCGSIVSLPLSDAQPPCAQRYNPPVLSDAQPPCAQRRSPPFKQSIATEILLGNAFVLHHQNNTRHTTTAAPAWCAVQAVRMHRVPFNRQGPLGSSTLHHAQDDSQQPRHKLIPNSPDPRCFQTQDASQRPPNTL